MYGVKEFVCLSVRLLYFDQQTHACARVRMVENDQKHLKMSKKCFQLISTMQMHAHVRWLKYTTDNLFLFLQMPVRVPLTQSPVFFLWQDWALGAMYTKITIALTFMGPDWWLKAAIEQLYQVSDKQNSIQLFISRTFKYRKLVFVGCSKLNNTRDCDKHLFGQVSTCASRYQLSILRCSNVHP